MNTRQVHSLSPVLRGEGRGEGFVAIKRKLPVDGRQPLKLPRSFYARPAVEAAPALIGKILVHRAGGKIYRAQIVETEAYVGEHDLACHASKGRTKRTEVMFGRAGHAYVYFIYGMYDMLNIVAADVDDAQAVLIRAAEPLDGWRADLSGPGKLARAMKITRADNGLDLTGEKLFFIDNGAKAIRPARSKRIGVDYAGRWTHALLRFFDPESRAVSKLPRAATWTRLRTPRNQIRR